MSLRVESKKPSILNSAEGIWCQLKRIRSISIRYHKNAAFLQQYVPVRWSNETAILPNAERIGGFWTTTSRLLVEQYHCVKRGSRREKERDAAISIGIHHSLFSSNALFLFPSLGFPSTIPFHFSFSHFPRDSSQRSRVAKICMDGNLRGF